MVDLQISRYRLLIAEDDDILREALTDVFAPHLETVAVRSGEEALWTLERQPVHLALCDMHMEELTGLDVIRQIKSELVALPCILMTADWTAELQTEAEAAEAYCVLHKPVRRRTLMGTLAAAVEAAYHDAEFRRRLLAS
jgi:DNA-binding NtrC family response regulator